MSEIEEKDIWLSATEIASLGLKTMPDTRGRVAYRAKKEGWKTMPRQGKGGGVLFSFQGLPQETQQEIKREKLIWNQICRIAVERKKLFTHKESEDENTISEADRDIAKEGMYRLIHQNWDLFGGRETLAKNLEISLEELAKYEHGEKIINLVQLRKLHKLGFDVCFLVLGESPLNSTTNKRKIISNEIKQEVGHNATVTNNINNS